jgi:hypothetical protein
MSLQHVVHSASGVVEALLAANVNLDQIPIRGERRRQVVLPLIQLLGQAQLLAAQSNLNPHPCDPRSFALHPSLPVHHCQRFPPDHQEEFPQVQGQVCHHDPLFNTLPVSIALAQTPQPTMDSVHIRQWPICRKSFLAEELIRRCRECRLR